MSDRTATWDELFNQEPEEMDDPEKVDAFVQFVQDAYDETGEEFP